LNVKSSLFLAGSDSPIPPVQVKREAIRTVQYGAGFSPAILSRNHAMTVSAKFFFWPLILVLAVLLLQAGGRIAPQDEETTFRMTAHLLERGEVTIGREVLLQSAQTFPGFLPRTPRDILTTWAGPGLDGRLYPLYPHGQALLQAPLYLIGRTLGGWQPTLVSYALARCAVALLNPIVIALTSWLIMLFGSQLGFSWRLSLGLGCAYAFGTMALAYTHTHFGEPALALLYVGAAYTLFRARDANTNPRRWLILAGVFLGAAILVRVRATIVLPAFLIYAFVTQRRRWGLAAVLIPIGLAAIWIAAWNMVRFGSPLQTGDSLIVADIGFNTPLLFGLYGLLLSPGKGLFVYNPIALAGMVGVLRMLRRRRAEALLFVLISLTLLVFHAVYDLWSGGWNWGPRFLLPLLPFWLLGAGDLFSSRHPRLMRAVVVAACGLGLAINLPAALVDHSRYLVAYSGIDPDHYLERSLVQFDRSPVVRQWPVVAEVAALYARRDTWSAARQVIVDHQAAYTGGGSIDAVSGELLWADEFMRLNTPDFWFMHLGLLGVSPIWLGLSVLLLLALIFISGRKVFQRMKDEG
jgi:cadmium resistance protein CadD (predicted permease)